MQALTKLNPTDPVRFDSMNAILGEIEARDEDLLDKINDLKEASTAFKAFPKTTKLYEVTESGIYLTPNSGIEDLPEGWTQSRHLLIVFNCGNTVYSGQIIMPYRTAPSPKKMAFRVCLAEGSKWDEVSTTTKTSFSLGAGTGYTIISQNCYIQNGQTYINALIKKTDGSVFGTGNLYIAASNIIPAGVFPCASIGYKNVSGETVSSAIPNFIQATVASKNIMISNTVADLKAIAISAVVG